MVILAPQRESGFLEDVLYSKIPAINGISEHEN